jgi:hypothetical protein
MFFPIFGTVSLQCATKKFLQLKIVVCKFLKGLYHETNMLIVHSTNTMINDKPRGPPYNEKLHQNIYKINFKSMSKQRNMFSG